MDIFESNRHHRLSPQEKLILRALAMKGPATSGQVEDRLSKAGSVVKNCARHLHDLDVHHLVRKYGTHYGQGNRPHPVWIITSQGDAALKEES